MRGIKCRQRLGIARHDRHDCLHLGLGHAHLVHAGRRPAQFFDLDTPEDMALAANMSGELDAKRIK
ncbi:MAG: hypothetical protein PHP85_12590 [Gallionella sp.]|nr:hypothetical protein [Gallionella sp.]